jgi:hypothetical protein
MSSSSTIPNSSNIGDDYQQQQQNQQFSSFDQHQQNPNNSSSSLSTPSTILNNNINNNNNNNDNILTQMLHQIQQLQSTVSNQQHQLQALHNPSSSVKPSKPGVFTGSKIGSGAYLWLEDLKNYFLAAGVYGNHRTVFAVAHLKEEALLWKTSISELSNPQLLDFDTFGELFLKRFQPISSNLEAREQLRRLKYNGNIQQYVSSFQSLMQKITDMTNTDKLDYFSNGLSRSLKLELIKQNVTDLQQAINIAVRISSIDNHITNTSSYNNINNNNNNTNNNTPLSSSTTTSSDNMQIENMLNNIESSDNNNDMGLHLNDGHELNVIGNRNRFGNYNNGRNGTGFKNNNNNGSNNGFNGFSNRNNNNNNNYNYNNNSNIKCYYCGKFGHVQNKCRKLAFDNSGRNGFRNNYNNSNSNNNNRFNNYNTSNSGNSSKNEYGQRQ